MYLLFQVEALSRASYTLIFNLGSLLTCLFIFVVYNNSASQPVSIGIKLTGRPLAVIVQCLPFALLHVGKPELESIGSILAGLYLGVLALRANSMLPCAILHIAAALTMDLLATLNRMGHLG